MILTIDIGGSALKYALFEGELPEVKGELPLGEKGADNLIKKICEVYDVCSESGRIKAIAIDSAGLIDSNEGKIISAANLGIDEPLPLCDIIGEKYGLPVYIANDVNAAAIGEMAYGAARENVNYVFVAFGTGVGGAAVIGRRLYEGKRGLAGEIGHFITHPNGIPCPCGRKGCFERYASVPALVAKAAEYDPSVTNGRELFDRYYAGDENIIKTVDEWMDEIVLGLVSVTHLLDPGAIVLGGGIMNEKFLVPEIEKRLRAAVMKEYGNICVRGAELGNAAALYGMLFRANLRLKEGKNR